LGVIARVGGVAIECNHAGGCGSWLKLPYVYGIIGGMKKTLNIDEELLKEAKESCGASTDT
jgi:hypothetical protein